MRAKLNGEDTELADGATIADVLRERDLVRNGVAVAMNGELIRRSRWEETTVAEGARIEILTAVQGG